MSKETGAFLKGRTTLYKHMLKHKNNNVTIEDRSIHNNDVPTFLKQWKEFKDRSLINSRETK